MRATLLALALAGCTVQQPEPVYVPAAAPVAADPAVPSGSGRGCSGNETLRIVDETVDSLNIHGNCSAFISGSRISGVLDIHGNSHVTIENSTIDARVDLHGNAVLTSAGSTYTAGIDTHGNAVLDDRGNNRW